MKSLSLGILHLTLLTALFACGKNNETGKKANSWPYNNPYSTGNPLTNINSPFSIQGMSLNQVMAENPCRSGFGGMTVPGMPPTYGGQRIPIRIPLVHFPTSVSPGDVYVGVTSYGDVAVVAGQAPGQPPIFEGYMCPRSFAPTGQGQLMNVTIGSYSISKCLFNKSISKAKIAFPGGGEAEFRWVDGGTSVPATPQTPPNRITQFGYLKFSFCQ